MASAYDIVMDSRKELVSKVIAMIEKGYVFTAPEWNREALRPMNPLSGARYKGGNKLRLLHAVLEHEYKDPRWMTAKQLKKAGYYIKKGEKGILCEKWIFTKELNVKNEKGEMEKVTEVLDKPMVSFFNVFNAEQVKGFPQYVSQEIEKSDIIDLLEKIMLTSECPIKEVGQENASYNFDKDEIYLPLRQFFKDETSFVKTVLHEMSHSTGHKSRLNRKFCPLFGSPEYAREELRAEVGALFTEIDLGIYLEGQHMQDHSNYLLSWIEALKKDPNELFRACADAEKISERLVGNYERRYKIEKKRKKQR